MPKITVKFASADVIPSELKAFAKDDHSVEIWAGDNVAGETNPGLEANKNTILREKGELQTKYDNLLAANNDTSREVMELRSKVASGSGNQVTAEDMALLGAVKAVNPQIKPDALKKELESLPTLRTENETFKTRDANRAVFAASGFKNEKVFTDLLGNKEKNPNLEKVVVEKETVDGKAIDVVYAHVKGSDGAISKQKLDEYVKTNPEWEPYTPVLKAGTGGSGDQQIGWLPQESAGGQGGGSKDDANPLDAFINKQNETNAAKENPLLRKQPSASQGANLNVPQN